MEGGGEATNETTRKVKPAGPEGRGVEEMWRVRDERRQEGWWRRGGADR